MYLFLNLVDIFKPYLCCTNLLLTLMHLNIRLYLILSQSGTTCLRMHLQHIPFLLLKYILHLILGSCYLICHY